MKAFVLLAILLTAPAWLHSQNYTLLYEGDKAVCSICKTQLGYNSSLGWVTYSVGHWHNLPKINEPLISWVSDTSKLNLKTLQGKWIGNRWTVAPSEYFDSLMFETRQGRECATLADSYLQDIYRLEDLNKDKGKLIEIQSSVIENQNKVIEDYPKEMADIKQKCSEQKVKLKQKIRKLWKVIVLESGVVITVLVILLL